MPFPASSTRTRNLAATAGSGRPSDGIDRCAHVRPFDRRHCRGAANLQTRHGRRHDGSHLSFLAMCAAGIAHSPAAHLCASGRSSHAGRGRAARLHDAARRADQAASRLCRDGRVRNDVAAPGEWRKGHRRHLLQRWCHYPCQRRTPGSTFHRSASVALAG